MWKIKSPFTLISDEIAKKISDDVAIGVRSAMNELNGDTVSFTIGPITIPEFTIPIKINTKAG